LDAGNGKTIVNRYRLTFNRFIIKAIVVTIKANMDAIGDLQLITLKIALPALFMN
tara:strand:+ start:1050 stop:1214 length:165 start_codon:yes stop_codon:yes gene_type:complete